VQIGEGITPLEKYASDGGLRIRTLIDLRDVAQEKRNNMREILMPTAKTI
jgi:hypothetical protein